MNTDIDQTTLQDVLNNQPWCLSTEKTTTPNKIRIMTTKENLEKACGWLNHMLVNLYEEYIEHKLDVTTLKKKMFPTVP